jgi:hypothetical protein
MDAVPTKVSGNAGASAGAGAMDRVRSYPISQFTGRVLFAVLLTMALASTSGIVSADSAQEPAADWDQRETPAYLYLFDPQLSTSSSTFSPDEFVDRYGAAFDKASDELSQVFGLTGQLPITVWVDAKTTMTSLYPSAQGAVASPVVSGLRPGDLVVDATALARATDVEAINAIRGAVARQLLIVATDGKLSAGFMEGMVLYAQRPITAVVSRYAADVQNANAQSSILTWADLNRDGATVASDLGASEAYAITAYLFERYSIAEYQTFLNAFRTQPSWREALQVAYKTDPAEMEKGWRNNISRWTNGGWKTNVIAAFDLDPARALLERGNYTAANALLDRSEKLFGDLGDEENLKAIEALISQSAIGSQAETFMAQTQQALEHFSYAQANDLLSQAEDQYAQLPPEQRPIETIQQYRDLTNQGLMATAELANAHKLANSWTDYPDARESAITAGQQFAALGDADHVAESRDVLADIDRRQRRLVYLLGGFALVSGVWLLLWRRTSAAKQLQWPKHLPGSSSPSETAN